MTNTDKIRSMNDEEMAKYITDGNGFQCNDCPSGQLNSDYVFSGPCDRKCFEHCLEWLKQEVEEEK